MVLNRARLASRSACNLWQRLRPREVLVEAGRHLELCAPVVVERLDRVRHRTQPPLLRLQFPNRFSFQANCWRRPFSPTKGLPSEARPLHERQDRKPSAGWRRHAPALPRFAQFGTSSRRTSKRWPWPGAGNGSLPPATRDEPRRASTPAGWISDSRPASAPRSEGFISWRSAPRVVEDSGTTPANFR